MKITVSAVMAIIVLVCATAGAASHHWPQGPLTTIGLMLEKYGKPDQYDNNSQVWFNNGKWKRTIVHRKSRNYLEQTIAYLVPQNRIARLKRFNSMISVSPTAGELTFTSESEDKNRLAFNLADEIVTGRKTVLEARAFFAKTLSLSRSGKSSSYLEDLRFAVDNERHMTPTGADR